jgi:Zn-dependent protease with chaperone function
MWRGGLAVVMSRQYRQILLDSRVSSVTLPSTLRRLLGLLAATVLLPLAVMLLGLWEGERGLADWQELEASRVRLNGIVAALEARAPPPGRPPDYSVQFRRNGQLYGGPIAVTQAQAARDEVATLAKVMDLRRVLPPVVVWAAGLAAAISAVVLLAGAAFGTLGRTSREALVRGFALMRHGLPAVLAIQVVLGTVAFVAAVVFEAAALAQPGFGTGEFKMLAVAAIAVLGSLFMAGTALAGLRGALRAFEPDPLHILGRRVTPDEAPGLWRLVGGLAERLGALKPDAIVVGLTEGFFVSAGPKILEPGSERLSAPTLYVPLPYLPLLRTDELASIIGHELAHFAGGDTAYSLRFLPIYAGVSRSLDAVAMAGSGSGFGLLTPAMRLGLFVMDQFHHAVRHWSRAREFAADAFGAGPTSPEAAARALLRTDAIGRRVVETLNAAAAQRHAAPPDLVAATLERVIEAGLDDPLAHLGTGQAHPTDTHPPTRERIAQLGCSLTPELLAAIVTVPPPSALGGLAVYFADPAGLCRTASADFLAVVEQQEQAYHAQLEAAVAGIEDGEHVVYENTRPGAIFFAVAGVVFMLIGLALVILGMPGLSAGEAQLVGALPLVFGAAFTAFGLWRLRRGDRPTMILRPDGLTVPGLDRPIAWDSIADLDMTLRNTGMVTRLLLPPEAPFPQRVAGARRVGVDVKRRIVTIKAGLPAKMKPDDFAELLGRYRRAAEARRLLAEATGGAPAPARAPFQ